MYNKEQIADIKKRILNSLSIGNSLVNALKEDNMPSRQMVYNWLNAFHEDYDAVFLDNYTRAREEQADFYADEIIEISDTEEDVARAKVRIDARKWKAGKMKPKVYGDRVVNENENKNINIELTREERQKEIDTILEKAKNSKTQ